ncbi:MAG: 2-amino-4-hydroxy-6-hydroxymethyldihydropteridine diphosphokinase [Chloracidobacterium sp.]|uniref:2-amino-4-hydroxy-6-hydroxymethyldihydropteridine pyrophosphokinase n=1 Tax=Chloracidobacterium validum TaxID=2821543 RepID=A0ABX8B595_9BACT|nr:2-amino-4-hydroxy-6-hydroxymethyldihydropteridine diphosphokinase [Chloracidobacterium validum]QUW02138.1 2-amino-4-hydroxy-6-hydroxymethyldihydropteridine diphosphokinase [Chloracidobacterium validum]
MARHTFYLGLGSNLGDRQTLLERAIDRLTSRAERWRRAPWYATAPVDYLAQPWFLNTVLEVTTDIAPAEMLTLGLQLEADVGRVRSIPKGARPLDVDVLLCQALDGQFLVSDDPTLTLPHPRLHLRRFVLVPLCDLIPTAEHPHFKQTFAALLAACPDNSPVHAWDASAVDSAANSAAGDQSEA